MDRGTSTVRVVRDGRASAEGPLVLQTDAPDATETEGVVTALHVETPSGHHGLTGVRVRVLGPEGPPVDTRGDATTPDAACQFGFESPLHTGSLSDDL